MGVKSHRLFYISLLKICGAINKEDKIFIKWNLKFQKTIDKDFVLCYNLMEQEVPIQKRGAFNESDERGKATDVS